MEKNNKKKYSAPLMGKLLVSLGAFAKICQLFFGYIIKIKGFQNAYVTVMAICLLSGGLVIYGLERKRIRPLPTFAFISAICLIGGLFQFLDLIIQYLFLFVAFVSMGLMLILSGKKPRIVVGVLALVCTAGNFVLLNGFDFIPSFVSTTFLMGIYFFTALGIWL